MTDDEKRAGVVTASSGNHGMAVAFGMNLLGIDGIIYLPESASPLKVHMLETLGAKIRIHGSDCDLTEAHARRQAEKSGQIYISPYNDPLVVGGQGTIGLEILDRLPQVDCVMVSVGGGGLISGCATVAKAQPDPVEVIGGLPLDEREDMRTLDVEIAGVMDGYETAVIDGVAINDGHPTTLPDEALFSVPDGPPVARLKLGGPVPFRVSQTEPIDVPNREFYADFLKGSGEAEVATTMAYLILIVVTEARTGGE